MTLSRALVGKDEGDVMSYELKEAFEFYLANQDEMVEKYCGKVVAIKNGKVLGAYDDELAAINDTKKTHKLGTFIVQRVSEGDEAYTITINSPGVPS